MISEKEAELIIERLIQRVQKANIYFLKEIGNSVKQIRELTPSEAHKLVQMLKYGGTYEEIIREISKYTNLNIKEVEDIFEIYAKKDAQFSKKFFEYRNIPFESFIQNKALKQEKKTLIKLFQNQMYNYTRPNILGYTIKDLKGNVQFLGLKETYNRVLDEALVNVDEGIETFDSAMSNILKQIGGSGLKTIEYESGRSVRLDSVIRMHMQDGTTQIHNINQEAFGEQFKADGIEISVHEVPAPDHALVQGRQFRKEEFEKFQTDKDCKSYDGIEFPATSEETGYDRRSIGQYNCYHKIYPIIIGVSKPNYTNEQLQKIIDESQKEIEIDGKKYNKYQCSQIQRRLERQIREQKDIQILGKSSNNEEMIYDAQAKITQLTHKYKEVSDKAGLQMKIDRLQVEGYRKVATKNKK